mmetsp:Transcript_3891/g.6028  ORF Transcript_3891/g.6028 Transcript_3891/m.6028 type:complete len:268 (-) Transcript_3891:67-870(-)
MSVSHLAITFSLTSSGMPLAACSGSEIANSSNSFLSSVDMGDLSPPERGCLAARWFEQLFASDRVVVVAFCVAVAVAVATATGRVVLAHFDKEVFNSLKLTVPESSRSALWNTSREILASMLTPLCFMPQANSSSVSRPSLFLSNVLHTVMNVLHFSKSLDGRSSVSLLPALCIFLSPCSPSPCFCRKVALSLDDSPFSEGSAMEANHHMKSGELTRSIPRAFRSWKSCCEGEEISLISLLSAVKACFRSCTRTLKPSSCGRPSSTS